MHGMNQILTESLLRFLQPFLARFPHFKFIPFGSIQVQDFVCLFVILFFVQRIWSMLHDAKDVELTKLLVL